MDTNNIYLNINYKYLYVDKKSQITLNLKTVNTDINSFDNIKFICNKQLIKYKTLSANNTKINITSNLQLDTHTLIIIDNDIVSYDDFYNLMSDVENSTLYYYFTVDEVVVNSFAKTVVNINKLVLTKHAKTKIVDIVKNNNISLIKLTQDNTKLFNYCNFYFKVDNDIYFNSIELLTNKLLSEIAINIYTQNNIFSDTKFNILHNDIIKTEMINKRFCLDVINTYDIESTNCIINKDIDVVDKDDMYNKLLQSTKINNKRSYIACTYNYNYCIINAVFGISLNARSTNQFNSIQQILNKIFCFKDCNICYYAHNFVHDLENTETNNFRFGSVFRTAKNSVLSAFLTDKLDPRRLENLYNTFLASANTYNKRQNKNKINVNVTKNQFRNMYVSSQHKYIDSYILLHKSLASCCNDLYSTHQITNVINKNIKKTGDLDYNISRNSKTVLTYDELSYIFNDTYALSACMINQLREYKSVKSLPLTATSKVRNNMKERCKDSDKATKQLLKDIQTNSDDLAFLEHAFAGGYTNGNYNYVGKNIKTKKLDDASKILGIGSIDLTSAYPYQIVSAKFPMSKIAEYHNKKFDFVTRLMAEHDLELNTSFLLFRCDINLKRTTNNKKVNVLYASVDKNKKAVDYLIAKGIFKNLDEALYDIGDEVSSKHYTTIKKRKIKQYNSNVKNGRFIKHKNFCMFASIVDVILLSQIYDITNFIAYEIHVYNVNYLPRFYFDAISEFFEAKTALKGIPSRSLDYMNGKANLNSIYGMLVEKRHDEEYIDNDDYTDIDTVSVNVNESDTAFYFKAYQWGVLITANTRRLIVETALRFATRYIYSDTDSIKFYTNSIKKDYINIIQPVNNKIVDNIKKACAYHCIDYDKRFKFQNAHGIFYEMGVFDVENDFLYNDKKYSYAEFVKYLNDNKIKVDIWDYIQLYHSFKYICPKKYLYTSGTNDVKIKHTISGVSKKAIDNVINAELEKGNDVNYICDNVIGYGLHISEDNTGKSMSYVNRHKFAYVHTDYQDNVVNCYHYNSKALSPARFQIREESIVLDDDEIFNDDMIVK